MDDTQLSPEPFLNGLATPLTFSFDDFAASHTLNCDVTDASTLSTLDNTASWSRSDYSPVQLFDGDPSELLDYLAALPKMDTVDGTLQRNETNCNDPSIDDTTQSAPSALVDSSNQIEGLNDAQETLFDALPVDIISGWSRSPAPTTTDGNCWPKLDTSGRKSVIKSTDVDNAMRFLTSTSQVIRTGGSLVLVVSPSLQQHARYASDLNKTLRYISVPNKDPITLMINGTDTLNLLQSTNIEQNPVVHHRVNTAKQLWLRITRTTLPYGDTMVMGVHPYPIWINNEHARAHAGSLFIPVTGRIVKIDNLIMERSKQNELEKMKTLFVYKSTSVDFNDFHPMTLQTAKQKIEKYQLRYSIFHFQIFLVDENNCAYPTDLICQTDPIHEYDPSELRQSTADTSNTEEPSVERKRKELQVVHATEIAKKPHLA